MVYKKTWVDAETLPLQTIVSGGECTLIKIAPDAWVVFGGNGRGPDQVPIYRDYDVDDMDLDIREL